MISKRLLTIASLVDNDAIVADIGSDHALLPIYLIKEKIATKAYAIDNKEGPISAAQDNIDRYNLQDFIEISLSEGLENLAADVNTLIIAGMGYSSIAEILDKNLEKAQKQDKIIIQCNKDLDKLRRYLEEHSFHVLKEKFIEINEIAYIILSVTYRKETISQSSYLISEYLLEQEDKDYLKYLEKRMIHLEKLKNYNEDFKNEYNEITMKLKTTNEI